MLSIPMPSLYYCENISVQISPNNKKNWIFFKVTQNVQDGISRPLGSLDIQDIKMAPVCRDALYQTAH